MNNSIRLIGAQTDLELQVQWRYSFLPQGSVVASMIDTVFVDVGGSLEPGVIDHHQAISCCLSSSRLVIEHPDFIHGHLVGPWIEANRIQSSKGKLWCPSIVTHSGPDFDAIVAIFLIEKLIADGMFPNGFRELVDYADRVDSGSERPKLPERRFDLYPLILMLQNACLLSPQKSGLQLSELAAELLRIPTSAAPSSNFLVLKLGLYLVGKWLETPDKDAAFKNDPLATALASFLEQDLQRFRQASDRYQHLGKVELPTNSGQTCFLNASRLSLCECTSASCSCQVEPIVCDKIYMRLGIEPNTQPTPLTIIEKKCGSGQLLAPPTNRKYRWIVSIDPHSDAESEHSTGLASLEGLGASLEWAEQRKRSELGTNSETRRGKTRFPEFPDIRDPWYDGRNHGYSIIDSPSGGTVLALSDVTEILKARFWEPLCEKAIVWRVSLSAGNAEQLQLEPSQIAERRLGEFLDNYCRFADTENYLIAVVKLRTGWSTQRIRDACRNFVSGNPEPLSLGCGEALISPKCTLVVLSQGHETYEPTDSIGSLLSLHFTLDQIEKDAHNTPGDFWKRRNETHVRDLRTRFIKAVSRYYAPFQDTGETFDDRAIRSCLEEVLQINQRRESTGDLLQLLDNGEQEQSQWRLNRLGVVIAFMGTIQTIVAVFDAIEPTWTTWLNIPQPIFNAYWANASFVLTLLCAIFLISLPSRRACWLFARTPYLKRLFPE